MTILMMDGFDLYSGFGPTGTRIYDVWINGTGPVTGRFSGSLGLGCNVNHPYRPLPAIHTGGTISVCFAIAKPTATVFADEALCTLYETGLNTAPQVTLQLQSSDGNWSVIRGGTLGSNILATTSSLPVGPADFGYHFVEMTTVIHDTAGSVVVKLDGVTIINVSGVDTKAGATANVGAIGVGGAFRFSSVDDLYVTDGASLGERKIVALRPSADTATKQWTPDSGTTNYTQVDDTQADGTTYVSTATPGNVDLYDLGNLGFTPASIDAVVVKHCAQKDDAATRTYRSKLKSGATTSDGATQGLTTTWRWTEDLYLTDPNTSAAWTASGVNGAQVGVECVA